MWQRIQTLYLLLATGLVAALFFCKKAGDIPYTEYWPYLILLILTGFLQVLALQGWLVFDFIASHNEPVFSVTAVFPVVAAILDFLAARNILADEIMVRSADRLRAAKRKKK